MADIKPWTPPESAPMQYVVKYGGIVAFAVAGIYAFTRFAPTMVDAVTLLDTLLQDTTHMAISGAVLLGTLWVMRETISTTGSINHLLQLPYWMVVNGLTRFFITIDPLSPITERIKSVEADKETFEHQFEVLDGLISNLKEKEAKYNDAATKAQRQGQAAARQGMQGLQDVSAHSFGSYRDAAASYAKTRARLEPMRGTFQQISQAADVTLQKLKIDRDLLADQWQTQQAIHKATDAAGRILGRSKSQVWQDAEQAESIINDKYGEELGHLDHLKRYAQPFLDSIDVDNASYNEDMLTNIQNSGAALIQSTAAAALPSPATSNASLGASSALSGLIQ